MTQVAGEVCDGFIAHGFTTERYLREVTLPNLAKGREKVGKSLDDFSISGPFFVVTGQNEEEMQFAESATRQPLHIQTNRSITIQTAQKPISSNGVFKISIKDLGKVAGMLYDRLFRKKHTDVTPWITMFHVVEISIFKNLDFGGLKR